jgi:pSer/pThr/pTyr-binding forkhead associated (FHA) protein
VSATRYDIGDGLIFGRSNECEVVLDHSSVSGKHAWIRRVGHRYVLIDLHSTNGTRVNKQRIKEKRLHDGDRFCLADVKGVFHDPAEAQRKKADNQAPGKEAPPPPQVPQESTYHRPARTCPHCGYLLQGKPENCPRCNRPVELRPLQQDRLEHEKTRRMIRMISSMAFACGMAGPLLLGVGWLLGIVLGLMIISGVWSEADADDKRLARRGIIAGVVWLIVVSVLLFVIRC